MLAPADSILTSEHTPSTVRRSDVVGPVGGVRRIVVSVIVGIVVVPRVVIGSIVGDSCVGSVINGRDGGSSSGGGSHLSLGAVRPVVRDSGGGSCGRGSIVGSPVGGVVSAVRIVIAGRISVVGASVGIVRVPVGRSPVGAVGGIVRPVVRHRNGNFLLINYNFILFCS